MVTYDQVKNQMDKYEYIATEELVWNAVRLINKMIEQKEIQKGQDISAICLDGPPGSGKTEFAKIMLKLFADYVDKDSVMIEYQCDPTTTKTELFEDINAAAAVAGDPTKVIIDGALLKAIDAVNEGKKVILFLDEYDKAREETDAFLLQFLQSGQLSTTQHQNAGIKKQENKKNLQVLLCKNDNRDQLSGPLERRLQFIHLDEMEPHVFFQVAKKKFPGEPENVNFITQLYSLIYKNKDNFNRIPACSEMLIAIQDASNYEKWNAPTHIVFNSIVQNLIKDKDSVPLFYELLRNSQKSIGVDLREFANQKTPRSIPDIKKLMTQNIVEKLEREYNSKIMQLEKEKEQYLDGTNFAVNNRFGLKSVGNTENILGNFNDSNEKIRRGKNVFAGSASWTKVLSIEPNSKIVDKDNYLHTMVDITLKNKDGVVYENGFRLNLKNVKINFVRKQLTNTNSEMRDIIEIYASTPIIPAKCFNDILTTIYKVSDYIDNKSNINANCLVYNESELEYAEKIYDNIYHYEFEGDNLIKSIQNIAKTLVKNATNWNENNVNEISNQLLNYDKKQDEMINE